MIIQSIKLYIKTVFKALCGYNYENNYKEKNYKMMTFLNNYCMAEIVNNCEINSKYKITKIKGYYASDFEHDEEEIVKFKNYIEEVNR